MTHLHTALLLTLLAASLCACETPPPAQPAAQEPVKAADAKPAEPAAAAKVEGPDGVGQTCFNDLACKGYLRCIDKRCLVPNAITGHHPEHTPRALFREARAMDSKPVASFWLELATSDSERERGLMYRRSMQEDWGMLFIYPDDGLRAFWMKNTYIPLDMVFLHSSGKVACILEDVGPLTLDPRPCDLPARYVLELKAGTARARGITRDAWMDVEDIAQQDRPLP